MWPVLICFPDADGYWKACSAVVFSEEDLAAVLALEGTAPGDIDTPAGRAVRDYIRADFEGRCRAFEFGEAGSFVRLPDMEDVINPLAGVVRLRPADPAWRPAAIKFDDP